MLCQLSYTLPCGLATGLEPATLSSKWITESIRLTVKVCVEL